MKVFLINNGFKKEVKKILYYSEVFFMFIFKYIMK